MNNELHKAFKSINIDNLNNDDKFELLTIFRNTKSPLIRNQLAFMFSDMHFNEAIPYILKKINQKNLYNQNGSLVYALTTLDTRKYFKTFIKIICEQGYEARLHAFEIVEKDVKSVITEVRREALNSLQKCRNRQISLSTENGENSRLHFIEQTIKLLLSTI